MRFFLLLIFYSDGLWAQEYFVRAIELGFNDSVKILQENSQLVPWVEHFRQKPLLADLPKTCAEITERNLVHHTYFREFEVELFLAFAEKKSKCLSLTHDEKSYLRSVFEMYPENQFLFPKLWAMTAQAFPGPYANIKSKVLEQLQYIKETGQIFDFELYVDGQKISPVSDIKIIDGTHQWVLVSNATEPNFMAGRWMEFKKHLEKPFAPIATGSCDHPQIQLAEPVKIKAYYQTNCAINHPKDFFSLAPADRASIQLKQPNFYQRNKTPIWISAGLIFTAAAYTFRNEKVVIRY